MQSLSLSLSLSLAYGNSESNTRCPVRSGLFAASFSVAGRGVRTGQTCGEFYEGAVAEDHVIHQHPRVITRGIQHRGHANLHHRVLRSFSFKLRFQNYFCYSVGTCFLMRVGEDI